MKALKVFSGCVLVAVFFASSALAGGNLPDEAKQIDKNATERISAQIEESEKRILGAIGEVKADTENILDIQQAVIIGSLPQDQSLITFANNHGQNPWLIAAVTGLEAKDLDELPAGLELKTVSLNDPSFKEMLKKAHNIRISYYNMKKAKKGEDGFGLSVAQLSADLVTTKRLEADLVNTNTVNTDLLNANMQVTQELHTTSLYVKKLEAEIIEAEKVIAQFVEAKELKTERFEAQTAHITTLNADLVNAKKIVADLIEARKIYVDEIHAKEAYIGELKKKLAEKDAEVIAAKQRAISAESQPPKVKHDVSPIASSVKGSCPDVINVRIGKSVPLPGGCKGFTPDDLGNAWRVNQ